MTIWILILVLGAYKFLESKQAFLEPPFNHPVGPFLENNVKTKRIFQICNLPQEMVQGDEGILHKEQWGLKGVLMLIRHGDRGPLQHVKDISAVKCGNHLSTDLKLYKVGYFQFLLVIYLEKKI